MTLDSKRCNHGVAADPENPAGNIIAVSTTEAELVAGAGSRYVSSSPLRDIDRLLAQGGAMAFIGKPCDVSALRRLALADPRVDAHIPLMLALHAALQAGATLPEALLAARQTANGDPLAVATALSFVAFGC